MEHSGLVTCYEVEQLRACIFFNKGICPSCYAEPLLKLRKSTSRHVHKATPARGLIRLGTYIEILPEHWESFKKGEGTWDCCGSKWYRPDFPRRYYFFVSRGLSDISFYRKVLADPYLVNLQISTDILAASTKGKIKTTVVPSKDRLVWFLKQPKVIFRFKTTPYNTMHFIQLAEELAIPKERVMETPLRVPGWPHYYGTRTYLEMAGWDTRTFGRCNTTCANCHYENGLLLCAAKPEMLRRLPSIVRPRPVRHRADQLSPSGSIWKSEVTKCMVEHGGQVTVQEAYRWFVEKYPALIWGKPNWKFKVRVALQRAGISLGHSTWKLRPSEANLEQIVSSSGNVLPYRDFCEIESATRPGVYYKIMRNEEGRLFCNCPSFLMNRRWRGVDIQDRYCKHTQRIQQLLDRGWMPDESPVSWNVEPSVERRIETRVIPRRMTSDDLDALCSALVKTMV